MTSENPCSASTRLAFDLSGKLNRQELNKLSDIVELNDFERGETIFWEGDPASCCYILNRGCVKIYKQLADGHEQITGFLFRGDFFGLAAAGRYAYTAEAVIPGAVCRFETKAFEKILDEFRGLERRLLSLVSSEVAAAQDQMLLLGRKTAKERVATFLNMLSHRAGLKGHDRGKIDIPMIRSEIASYLGLSTETVSRSFTELRKAGLIEVESQGKSIVIPDISVLAAFAGYDDEDPIVHTALM